MDITRQVQRLLSSSSAGESECETEELPVELWPGAACTAVLLLPVDEHGVFSGSSDFARVQEGRCRSLPASLGELWRFVYGLPAPTSPLELLKPPENSTEETHTWLLRVAEAALVCVQRPGQVAFDLPSEWRDLDAVAGRVAHEVLSVSNLRSSEVVPTEILRLADLRGAIERLRKRAREEGDEELLSALGVGKTRLAPDRSARRKLSQSLDSASKFARAAEAD